MGSVSAVSAELFATKGRALPACSEPLASRPAPGAAPGPANDDRDATPDRDQEGGPASVLSIDLRRALVPAAKPAASPKPAQPPQAAVVPPPPPRQHSMAGAYLAVVGAIAVAASILFALAAEAPAPQTPEIAAEEAKESVADVADAAPLPAEAAPEDAGEATSTLPSFDLVRVEPDGGAVIAGRAAPYAELVLLHNGEPIGTVKADWAGEWAFVSDQPLGDDHHRITLLVNDPDAEITLPESIEAPAQMTGTASPAAR